MRAAAHASVREFLFRPYNSRISEDRDWFKARNSSRRRTRSDARHAAQMARRAGAAIVSNRNDAHAYRNRIFLGRPHHIFVVETLQTLASSLGTRCESSDSRGAIRFASDAKPPR